MIVERSGILSIAVHGTGLLVKLGFLLALLHFCSPEVVGYYGLLAAIDLIVIYLAGLEFHTFTSRRYARHPSPARLRFCVACHRRLLQFTAPLAAALAVCAAMALQIKFSVAGFIALAVIVASGTIVQEMMRVMVLIGRPVESLTLGLLRTTGWQPIAIPLLVKQVDVIERIALLWALAAILAAVWGAYALRQALRWSAPPAATYIRTGLFKAWRFYLIGSASALQGNIERFVLQLYLGPASVGVFVFFQTIANTVPALLQSAVLNVGLPRVLVEFGQRRPGRLMLLRELCTRCFWIGLLISAVVMLVTWPLLTVVSSGSYRAFFWVLPVLIVAQLVTMTTQPIHLAFYGAHRDGLLMWLSLFALTGAIALTTLMAGTLGFPGVVVAPLAIAALVAAVRVYLLLRFRAKARL